MTKKSIYKREIVSGGKKKIRYDFYLGHDLQKTFKTKKKAMDYFDKFENKRN